MVQCFSHSKSYQFQFRNLYDFPPYVHENWEDVLRDFLRKIQVNQADEIE